MVLCWLRPFNSFLMLSLSTLSLASSSLSLFFFFFSKCAIRASFSLRVERRSVCLGFRRSQFNSSYEHIGNGTHFTSSDPISCLHSSGVCTSSRHFFLSSANSAFKSDSCSSIDLNCVYNDNDNYCVLN